MNIAICFTSNWSKYMPVVIYSILKHNSFVPINLFLLTDMNHKEVEYLLGPLRNYYPTVNVCILTPPSMSKTNVSPRFSVGTLWRLHLPFIPMDSVDKILYIDADTICAGNLINLYTTDISNYYVAGCRDVNIKKKHLDKIGADRDYINAGVMLLNIAKIKDDGLDVQWLKMVDSVRYPNHDQDIINITCKGRILHVHNQWNSSLSTGFAPIPIIVHYAGIKNPWVDKLPLSQYWFTEKGEYERVIVNPQNN